MPGAVIIREYLGKAFRVTVLDKGFEYEGKVYRSLTDVANVSPSTATWRRRARSAVRLRDRGPVPSARSPDVGLRLLQLGQQGKGQILPPALRGAAAGLPQEAGGGVQAGARLRVER